MMKIVFDAQKENRQCDNVQAVKKIFPTVSENSIKAIINTTQRSFAMQSLAKIACQKHFTKNFFSDDQPTFHNKTLNHPSIKGYVKGAAITTREDLIDNVDEVLKRGTPIGILFYANFLLLFVKIREDSRGKCQATLGTRNSRFVFTTLVIHFLSRHP